MNRSLEQLEKARFALQAELDGQKTQAERNRLGQFATPPHLAEEMLSYAKSLLPEGKTIRFIDPAIGTGSFYSALKRVFPERQIGEALGFEVDSHYGKPAAALWGDTRLRLELADFTQQQGKAGFNLLICNPPYVRHHHLSSDEKLSLRHRTLQACGAKIGGLAGLYCYFLGLSHAWLEEGAVSGWLIPSEFMDVNYGQSVRRYLLERVTLLHIHRFDPSDVQFADALVSSAVVWFRKEPPTGTNNVRFTFGGSLQSPTMEKIVSAGELAREKKWTRFPASDVRQKSNVPTIADFFKIKRGLATGHNGYFILSAEELAERKLPRQCFRPILPSPRYVAADEVEADSMGDPLVDRRLYLLDTDYDEEEIRRSFPALWSYLEEGRAQKLHERYLCKHRARWYSQENRPAPPIVCTYLGRGDAKSGRPFRFILNHSKATVANVYLAMYPTPLLSRELCRDGKLIRRVWEILNRITPSKLLSEGRVYGGGLHKLEPKELANVPVPEIAELLSKEWRPDHQGELF